MAEGVLRYSMAIPASIAEGNPDGFHLLGVLYCNGVIFIDDSSAVSPTGRFSSKSTTFLKGG